MNPLQPDHSHHDPELQAYVGNRFADPWSRLEPFLHMILIGLAFPAITLMVFLRPKLGYRVPKPWILVIAFHWLLFLAVLVNLLAYGWFRLKRDTPVGEYLAQFHARPLLPRSPMNQRPQAERWKMPGFPDNWWDMTVQQRREWARQHPREYQTGNADLYRREQELTAKEAADDEKLRPTLPHKQKQRRSALSSRTSRWLFLQVPCWPLVCGGAMKARS